jgi:hypothetical protein
VYPSSLLGVVPPHLSLNPISPSFVGGGQKLLSGVLGLGKLGEKVIKTAIRSVRASYSERLEELQM